MIKYTLELSINNILETRVVEADSMAIEDNNRDVIIFYNDTGDNKRKMLISYNLRYIVSLVADDVTTKETTNSTARLQ